MKIVIIRHGDPDYTIDSLTEKGWREAQLLAEKIAPLKVDQYFCSPLGRARDTASLTLKKAGREAKILPWLTEYIIDIKDPTTGEKRVVTWDLLPKNWRGIEENYDKEKWMQTDYFMTSGKDGIDRYNSVTKGIDDILADYGYYRDKYIYKTELGNDKTIVIFCHFGVKCIILAHLLGISPMVLWHSFIALPTSVTTLVTEEREKGEAVFRCLGFGDTSHLYIAGEQPSFAGRFCETYENSLQRH